MTTDFKTWQKLECDRFGISVDAHKRLLEVSNGIAAAGLGWPYDYLTSIISSANLDFAGGTEQIAVAVEQIIGVPQKSKPPCKQKYISKKARRVHSVG